LLETEQLAAERPTLEMDRMMSWAEEKHDDSVLLDSLFEVSV